MLHVFKPWMGLFHPPIVIYSMGKVGSTSIQATLEKLRLPNPIFHIHFLAWDYLEEVETSYRRISIEPPGHVEAGNCLRAFADRTWGRVRWKIITLVREPVGREISDLFENIRTFPELKKLSGEALVEGTILHMQELMAAFDESKDYSCNWFDRELKNVFAFDIFSVPFTPEKGYAIYQAQNADILLIRLEDLSRVGSQALQEFFGVQNVELAQANQGMEKLYRQAYKQTIGRIFFPTATLEKMYNTRFSRHFYSEDERGTFKERWSKPLL